MGQTRLCPMSVERALVIVLLVLLVIFIATRVF